MNQKQLDKLIQSKTIKALKLLGSEIAHLNKEIKSLKESLSLLSGKHDGLTYDYKKLCAEIMKRKGYSVSQGVRL